MSFLQSRTSACCLFCYTSNRETNEFFILGTVKPAHLINYIIPAMASTRGKPLFNCFRAHVHASTRCLLSKKALFQQPLRKDGPGWPSGWATPTRSRSGCLHYSVYSMIMPHQTLSKYLAHHISATTVTKGATWNSIIPVSSFKFSICGTTRDQGLFLQ